MCRSTCSIEEMRGGKHHALILYTVTSDIEFILTATLCFPCRKYLEGTGRGDEWNTLKRRKTGSSGRASAGASAAAGEDDDEDNY